MNYEEEFHMKDSKYPSSTLTNGLGRSGQRALLYATGMDEEDMKKPFVAVIGSFSEMVVEAHHFDAMVLLAQSACIGAMSFEKGTSNGSAFLLFEKIWFF